MLGALWIYYKGWEDLVRTISISIYFGFLAGGIMVLLFYIVNQHSLDMLKGKN
jgi:hypothetical protein